MDYRIPLDVSSLTVEQLAASIDHTLLKPDATSAQALEYRFGAVCVATSRLPLLAGVLKDTDIAIAAVIGFPHGNAVTTAKVSETVEAVRLGATEIDMVVNIGFVKDGNYEAVADDISAVVAACRGKALVKVILETAALTQDEKRKVAEVSKKVGAHFLKTSTGFGSAGASVQDIELLSSVADGTMGVKASGGIRSLETAIQMLRAGATRIGCSASVEIIKQFQAMNA